ncbi:uncharacterized protein BJX67DRAFT_382389 [Aspergillus lucknowensis]|uniref:Uncharacterized protein n=1 Tax=Aspergillus lucknowensis TaxID=176173 RepID=A0ABR4LRI3_9EURO
MPPTSRKSSPEQQRGLLSKYNISIEGPIRPRDWPVKYAPIFGLVRDAERLRYEDYYRTDVGNDIPRRVQVAQMSNRVEELVSRAYSLRMSLANEETWRMETEDLILQRFKAEVDCHVCNGRRWLSDIQALPSCPRASEKLQRIRSARSLCRCDEHVRAKWLIESTSHLPITTHASCTVTDISMLEIQNKVLAHHKPDRVLSLGRNYDLKRLLDANPDLIPTVVKSDIDSCFPFLVLEAKSEKGSVGFESIERQTAFPVRAMLGIQKSLDSGADLPQIVPLVWFLANRGDEWRVYGCVPDRTRIRIIDLWHGCILRHDSALQLLLLIDFICDWARDVFAEQVMSSLRRRASPTIASQDSPEEVVHLQPSFSREAIWVGLRSPGEAVPEEVQGTNAWFERDIKIESTDVLDEATRTAVDMHLSESSTPMRAPEILLNKLTEATSKIGSERATGRKFTVTTEDDTGNYENSHAREGLTPTADSAKKDDNPPAHAPGIEAENVAKPEPTGAVVEGTGSHTDTLDGESPVWTIPAEPQPEPRRSSAIKNDRDDRDTWPTHVVRSDKNVQLIFRSISLPESTYGLNAMLKVLGGANTADTARKLLSIFNRHDPFVVESGYINSLWKAWGGDFDDETRKVQNLYVCLVWRARFEYQDWTLIKELSCITASKDAIKALSAAGKISTVDEIPQKEPGVTNRANRLIHPVRYLPIAELVQAAARDQCLSLLASKGHAAPDGWTEDHGKAKMSQHFWDCFESHRDAFVQCSERIDVINEGRAHMIGSRKDMKILPIFQVPDIAKERGLALLKRPDGIQADGDRYCMFAFDDWHTNLPVIGNVIKSFLEEGHGCFYGTNRQLSAADRRTLARWAGILALMEMNTVKRRRLF